MKRVSASHPWRRSWLTRVLHDEPALLGGYVLDIFLPLMLGLFTLLGGWDRVTGNGWITMREYGGPYLWGSVLLALAVVLLLAHFGTKRLFLWMLHVAAIIYGLAAVWFLNASLSVDTVSFWGFWLCTYAAGNQVWRANIYRSVT